jgi:tetrahydromethanopterin S-methyltransferase subunit B
MNDKEAAFDSLFKEKGGLFYYDHDRLPTDLEGIRQMANEMLSYLKPFYPELPDVYFNFINNPSLNATAGKYNGAYYIGLNIGTFILLSDMFTKMLSNQNILPSLGNAKAETNEKYTLDAIINQGVTSFNVNNPINAVKPKDPTRKIYCSVFLGFVIDFLVLHEFCHIARGHLGYAKSLKYNLWSELEAYNKQGRFKPLISQTLEMDADSFAINHVCLRTHYIMNKHNTLPELINFKNFETFFQSWTFAIYSFFRLCIFTPFDIDKARELDHPPAPVRLRMITLNIVTKLLEMGYKQDEVDRCIKAQLQSMKEAEKAFTYITYSDNSLHILLDSYQQSDEYVEDIVNNWNNVYPLIKPFAYGNLPKIREVPVKFKKNE